MVFAPKGVVVIVVVTSTVLVTKNSVKAVGRKLVKTVVVVPVTKVPLVLVSTIRAVTKLVLVKK